MCACELEVRFDREGRSYRPGDAVRGEVVVTPDQDVSCRARERHGTQQSDRPPAAVAGTARRALCSGAPTNVKTPHTRKIDEDGKPVKPDALSRHGSGDGSWHSANTVSLVTRSPAVPQADESGVLTRSTTPCFRR